MDTEIAAQWKGFDLLFISWMWPEKSTNGLGTSKNSDNDTHDGMCLSILKIEHTLKKTKKKQITDRQTD